MSEATPEQRARDLLERIGIVDTWRFSAGDLVELANLIADSDRSQLARQIVLTVRELGGWWREPDAVKMRMEWGWEGAARCACDQILQRMNLRGIDRVSTPVQILAEVERLEEEVRALNSAARRRAEDA